MIPILYKETEKEFRSNGIGQLDETIISETTEVLNGEFELYLEYPSTGQWFNEIKEFRYIQVIPNNQDEEHAFRIYEIDKTDDPESVKVYATTKSNELGDNLIEGFEYKKASPTMLYSQIKKNMLLPSNYNFVTDLTTLGNIDWKFRSPLNCILGEEGSMIQIFGGEIKRTNDYIYHYKRRGKDRVTSVRQEKNLDGFTQTVSTKGLVTKILPYYTYYPTPPEGFKGPVEPETMVIPIVTSAKAKDYPKEVLKAVDFSSYSDEIGATKTITKTEKLKNGKDKITKTEVFDEKKTRENLIAKADTYFTSMYKGVDEPKVTIDVDLYSLADSAEYADLASLEHIGISDTVDVWVPKYDIDVTVKVKRLVFDNLSEKVISLSAGSSSTSTYQSQKSDYTQITDDIQAYIDSALDNTVHMAANGSNRIWTGATRPTEGVREGDTWFEPLPDGHMAIHHFDGVEWIFVMDTTDTTDNANRIEEAMKEIAKAQKAADDANKEINDAITNAGFDTLPEVIQNIQNIANQAKVDADAALKEASDISIDLKLDIAQAKTDALDALDKANIATNKAETSITNSTQALRDASSALSGVTGLETSMTEEFTRIDGVLTSKVSSTEHDALKGTVTSQGTLITQNTNAISSKAEKTVVDTLADTVSTQATLITQNKDSIESKASNTKVDSLAATVSTQGTKITQNATAITTKADTSTVNTLTGRISTAEASLSVQAGLISSKVSQAEIDASIDARIGGRNRVVRANELDGMIDTAGDVTNGRNTAVMRDYIQVEPGETLTFTKSHSELSTDAGFWRWRWFDENEDYISRTENSSNEFQWVVPSNTYYIQVSYPVDSYPKIEKGNKATEWTPAPEDTTQAISAVQSDVTQKFDSITSTVSSLDGRVSQNKQTIDGFTQTMTGIDGRVSQNKQTIDGFTRTVSTLDGKVSTVQQTVNGLTTSVSNNSGDISTVQQTVRGLQTTVAGKASLTQFSQLETGFKLFASNINTVNKNLASRWVSQKINNDGTTIVTNTSRATPITKIYDNTTHLTVEDGTWGGWYNSAFFWYRNNSDSGYLGKYDLGINEDPGENIVTVEIPPNAKYFIYHTTPNMSKETKIEVGTEATGLFYDDREIKSEISVLESNINMRVTKGELMSQINIEAGRTLIQSDKLVINASTTTISGTAYMDGAVLKNLSVDGAKLKNATIANAKIVSLDAGKVSFGTMKGVRIEAKTGTIGDWILDGGVLHSPLNSGGYTTLKATGDVALGTNSPNPYSTTDAGVQIWHNGNIRWGNGLGILRTGAWGGNSYFRITSTSYILLDPTNTTMSDGHFIPYTSNKWSLGNIDSRWYRSYVMKGESVGSDSRYKKDQRTIPDDLLESLGSIETKMFKRNDDDRWEFGYIAQDFERELYKYSLKKYGIDRAREVEKEFSLLDRSESYLGLVYTEIAAMKAEKQQREINNLREELEKLRLDMEENYEDKKGISSSC